MVKVKPIEEIKKRFREGATVAPTRYKDAVAKVTYWKDRAASEDAEALYAARISEAVSAKRRMKVIAKLSNEDWRKPAVEKGATRIGPGMAAAVEKQAKNFSPFRAALEAVTLPPKTADPMANIDARVKPVVSALVAKKKEIKG